MAEAISLKIVVVTGSRADWGPLSFVANALRAAGHDVDTLACGQHLGDSSSRRVDLEGWGRTHTLYVPMGPSREDSAAAVGVEFGRTASSASHWMEVAAPDLVVVLGDRFEILAAATAAFIHRVPIAHIAGGDVTEGSLDDGFRNAITMLASLHFAGNMAAATRIADMRGDALVWDTGSPSVDRILNTEILGRERLASDLRVDPERPVFLVNFQPATRSREHEAEMEEMLAALHTFGDDVAIVAVGSNLDEGGPSISGRLEHFCSTGAHWRFFQDLPGQYYLSLLHHAACLVGNSSSGYFDAPVLGTPVVNIGARQSGRVQSACIENVQVDRHAIARAIERQIAHGRYAAAYPYGRGHSAEEIARLITAQARQLKKEPHV